VGELRLEVRDYADPTEWRWVLTENGQAIAEHAVKLDLKSWQCEAFRDLPGWISWHASPDYYREDEADIVAGLGHWIGARVLGPVAPALADRSPATVRVILPAEAADLAFRPLELAHAGGRPLAAQRVTLVTQLGPEHGKALAPVRERLRVLGLFSLPEGGRTLNLRRERQALVELVGGINAAGKAADVRVLQYGVTRESLRSALGEAEGWDIIHISGHGAAGRLVLETATGQSDLVDAAALGGMLEAARGRLKLVTLSACSSAAATADDQRRLLGLPIHNQAPDTERSRAPRSSEPASGALATELTRRLGCAVLAMRFPVDDEFAIALSEKLYDLLATGGEPLPQAVGLALQRLTDSGRPWTTLSLVTPALFGEAAAGLRLAAPARDRADGDAPAATRKMSGFTPQPERFVGRTGVMTRASAALARKSGIPGVLLHGMPGGGKTACALELAYTHEHAFDRLIWHKAPDEGSAADGALASFALTLERYLPGFRMMDAVASATTLEAFLPRLTTLMERHRVLLVIDNIESLLTERGEWREASWGKTIAALTAHRGLGRLILTSRRVPAGLTGPRVESVDALSPDEALLLVRDLPNLRALARGEIPGIERPVACRLARRALEAARGHPKLLELAEGQAADPVQLGQLLEAAGAAWTHDGLPDGFFAAGEAGATGDYPRILAFWTRAVADRLAPGERDLFWFLCCLEEGDRERFVLDHDWARLSRRLGRECLPPDLNQALAAIAARGLVAIQGTAIQGENEESFTIHPLVAAAGRAQAGEPFLAAADTEVAAYWELVFQALSGDDDEIRSTVAQVHAGLAAVPYLIRQEQWERASYLLDWAFALNPSRANAVAMLPAIEQIGRHDPSAARVRAALLEVINPGAAEATMRVHLATTVGSGDYLEAYITAGRLVSLCLDSGRVTDALGFVDQAIDYVQRAGLGPWTRLGSEVQRLQVLTATGRHDSRILAEVRRLLDRMGSLPAPQGADEAVKPHNLREALLNTGFHAATQLRRWHDALDFNGAVIASMRDRRAPVTEIAMASFNNYGPLLVLGRINEALNLLLYCRGVFEQAKDVNNLGKTLSALAQVEHAREHGEAAINLQLDALRYSYLAQDAEDIAGGYSSLGDYFGTYFQEPVLALSCHLAAALICALTGFGGSNEPIDGAADDLHAFGADAIPPTGVADLLNAIGDIPGTDLAGLIGQLSSTPETVERTLRDLTAQAQALADSPRGLGSGTSPDARAWARNEPSVWGD
jgi:tetratricopeptide (TPR) repeat protein